ncbi:MAG: IS1595 family transposase [Bradyrhizobium sp.]|uniref:IS1595 family transposase n=1 Tax=Bradyrhizobium sp. TaxID=376 RepID=UPI0011FAF3F4|nr:IS1595 family transposase [Bradyrhizobium sp.]THD72480.1 MAG: IS1595 family transposase [Bradyrhizobium sp.]
MPKTSLFAEPHFQNDEAARAMLESILWADGPVCPHCGIVDSAYKTKRPGVYRCAEQGCRKDFSVTMKTVMERSHIALHKWLQAFHLMTSSKKGVSAHQLHRTLQIGYEAAWFMAHRIRESMRAGGLSPLGGGGNAVEADETYFGHLEGQPKKGRLGTSNMNTVLTLVERGGSARSFHLDSNRIADIAPILRANLSREAKLMTDEHGSYKEVGREFASHDTVNHSRDEYVRGDAYTNTVEGFYSIFKRGMKGVYQHCAEKHLHRYLSEFDFRYSNRVALGVNDGERRTLAIKGAAGKRLTYRGRH